MIKQKITLLEMEKLKKDIESKDNEIKKIKEMQQKNLEEKNKQINDSKEEQKRK
ncbi:hypothetical protein RFI_38991 [Reticulomyxa filosa]|uniref:Uncharacterized protein n=1 Tax=Reticulomyxa filosa TaxID=46433 RepID=X6L8Z7_RETFI|nr:hypothetical protein RFI_38991 [Reticulomyxa filosa]|eukprot:ETN98502.1 hypothetical protein RFI_38991 [Reticulomyxa filosa]